MFDDSFSTLIFQIWLDLWFLPGTYGWLNPGKCQFCHFLFVCMCSLLALSLICVFISRIFLRIWPFVNEFTYAAIILFENPLSQAQVLCCLSQHAKSKELRGPFPLGGVPSSSLDASQFQDHMTYCTWGLSTCIIVDNTLELNFIFKYKNYIHIFCIHTQKF